MARLWANLILKFNRSQLQKRKVREFKDIIKEKTKTNSGELVFRELNKEELESIKSKIREDARKEIRNSMLMNILIILLMLVLVLIFYFILFS